MNSRLKLAGGAALLVLAMASANAVYAQETTSSIHGTVSASGAPVANAAVAIVHTPSGTRSNTVSDASGIFDARGLRIGGPYAVTVTAPGLPARTYNDIYLTVAETLDFDADLAETEVAAIEVVATSQGESESGPSTVLARDSIESVASVSRDVRDLARRDILVSQNARNGGAISVAGSNPRNNRITIDGVAAQDPYGLEVGSGLSTDRGPLSLDAIEQFSVAAVPTDVENGAFTGGALNIVLRSGGNSFHGSLFVNYLNEGMLGRNIGVTRVPQKISQENYGAFVSGPIIPDKLFFALSYESYASQDSTLFGPAGEGYANNFTTVNRAQIEAVKTTFNNLYQTDLPLGDFPAVQPILDKKYSAKFDWNITDQHRASLSYRYAESSNQARTDLSATTAALSSHWYEASYIDKGTTLEVNSDWTNRLSTTFRATYRDWFKGQMPASGQNFSDVTVCVAPTSDGTTNALLTSCQAGFGQVRFGPDLNRHANQLDIEEAGFQGTATYSIANHVFKGGFLAQHKDVFNIFLPNSRGTYYFDSLADFTAGRAATYTYRNAVSGNSTDAAAMFDYWVYSGYFQDRMDITDDLTVTAGFRYDRVSIDQVPMTNPNFVARQGFTNAATVDGLDVVMPRVSAEWKPTSTLKFTAGGGLFSGGYPEVLFATPFYNTGYVDTTATIRRCVTVGVGNCTSGGFLEAANASTVTPGFTNAVGAAALNGLTSDTGFGYTVPGLVRQFQQGQLPGTASISPTTEVIALSPAFQLPGEWKAYLSGEWRVFDGWRLGVDYVTSRTSNGITYLDYRAQPLVVNGARAVTPDGRPRYDGLTATAAQRTAAGITSTNLGDNRDLIATNADKGDSYTAAISVSKSFDFGLDFMAGYAKQSINELNSGLRFGTTAGSLYASVPAGFDPARDAFGTGLEEIEDRFKFEFGYRKKFFGDSETRLTLFGEQSTGRPYGFVMQDAAAGRSPVFGTNRTAHLLYMPDMAGYSASNTNLDFGLVRFADVANRDRFYGYAQTHGLLGKTGMVEKYSQRNDDMKRLDLQISQELPSLIDGHKFKVQVDVRNLLNLIDRDLGVVEEYFDSTTIARVQCADAGGVAVAATSAVCPRYLYSQVPTSITKSRNTQQSLWYAQVTLRYEF